MLNVLYLSEKGVSSFKVSAKDRDAIQEIQRDAVEGQFDILLVFMFDRLGRRDDETPFIVEWFVKNGIEVWSAMEGQLRFDSHVDKLMHYIRYWQASGESLKTSMRVKTRLSQLTEDGLYTGGSVPFGYRLEKRGRINKRNREVYDLAVDENEAEIIRLIFHKYVDEGYGSQRLCRYLHDNGIRGRDGKGFPNMTSKWTSTSPLRSFRAIVARLLTKKTPAIVWNSIHFHNLLNSIKKVQENPDNPDFSVLWWRRGVQEEYHNYTIHNLFVECFICITVL